MARTVVITKQGIPGSAATGYSPGGTDVAVSDGGTGASSAAVARTNLGVPATTDLTSHTGNTSNPHSVTKAQVGLSNVDNTSDVNKPVSTAQAAAFQPVDSDLTAIAALTTTAYGRSLLTTTDTGWFEPTYSNANGTVTPNAPTLHVYHLGIRKIGNIVFFIINAGMSAPVANGLLFTFPADMRIAQPTNGSGGTWLVGNLRFSSNGEVRLNGAPTSAVATGSYPV